MRILNLHNGNVTSTFKSLSHDAPVWVDAAPDEISTLKPLGITDLDVLEAQSRETSGYIEKKSFTSVVIFYVAASKNSFMREQLLIFLSGDFVATVGGGSYFDQYVTNRFKEHHSRTYSNPIEHVILTLISEVESRNSISLEAIESASAHIEDLLSTKDASLNTREVFRLKRHLILLNKNFWKDRELVFDLRNSKVDHFDPTYQTQMKLEEIYNSIIFDINTAETLKEILADTLDVYHTILSNRINKTIKNLTVVTVILTIVATVSAVPNTIATIFGIPYLPFRADTAMFFALGTPIYPWEFILVLLFIFSIVPSIIIFAWWKKISSQA